jgi:cysteine desulfurase
MLNLPVYLDYNATTPCDPRVVKAMLPYFSGSFGNAASRQHSYGWQAAEAVAIAREQVANLIGADSTEIFFTSGATESDNLVIKGVYEMYTGKGNHIITCSIEHKAVIDTCQHLEKLGAEISYLEVNENGQIDLTALEAAIRPTTILIAIMYANNEIGTILPIKEISAIARKHNVFLFSDATQAVGKIPVNVEADGIDIMAFSSHKMYGPKGVGALYIRRKNPRVNLTAQIDGGGHERGKRSGTLNVPGIVGFGEACKIAMPEMNDEMKRQSQLRDDLEKALLKLDDCTVNGDLQHRLPNTSNISFLYADGDILMTELTKNIAVSSGSACTSGSPEPSYVLKALGVEENMARGAIRFSLGKFTTEEEISYTIQRVTDAVERLRERKRVG